MLDLRRGISKVGYDADYWGTCHLRYEVCNSRRPQELHAPDDFFLEDAYELLYAFVAVCLVHCVSYLRDDERKGLTLWAYRNGRPIPTAFAPKHTALTMSDPRLTPPSTYTSQTMSTGTQERNESETDLRVCGTRRAAASEAGKARQWRAES